MLFLLTLSSEGGGFDPLDLSTGGNFLWTIVIFLVALPLIWKVVMGPVTRALETRDEHAKRSISAAERASADAEKARAEVEVMRGEIQAEAAEVLAEARRRAEAREHEIVEAAKQEASAMVEGARKSIRAEQDKAIAAIRKEVVDLSLGAASKVLEREVKGGDDRRLVQELIDREIATN